MSDDINNNERNRVNTPHELIDDTSSEGATIKTLVTD